MISVKGGTQTWSTAPKTDPSYKSDNAQTLSATDQSKVFGNGENVGDVLNKVADPNYIDPSKKMRTVGNNQMGKDAFMTMLLAQMKNQDPSNPLKSHEMAAQLAQFTQLEKLNSIDESITGLRKDNQPAQNYQALSFIGKSITTDTSKVSRIDNEAQHGIRFSLPQDAPELTMKVKDAEGNVVRTLEYKNLKSGKNELSWNGMKDDGTNAPVGEYQVEFAAKATNGRGLRVDTKTEGIISGVNFTPAGPQLMVGKQVISMADVKSISEPGQDMQTPTTPLNTPMPMGAGLPPGLTMPNIPGLSMTPPGASGATSGAPQMRAPAGAAGMPSNMMPIGQQDTVQSKGPKKVEVKPESQTEAQKRAKMSKGNLNDASMAQGLINKLNKEGAKSGMEG